MIGPDGTAPSRAAVEAAARALSVPSREAYGTALPLAPGVLLTEGLSTRLCPAGPSEPLRTVLPRNREHLVQLRSGVARVELMAAVEALPCQPEALSTQEIAELLELLGQANQDEGRAEDARFAYERLLRIAPAHRLGSAAGSGYDQLWNDVKRTQLAARTAPVSLAAAHALRWDGLDVPVSAPTPVDAQPGEHFVQWSEQGQWRGAWVQVGPAGGALTFSDAATSRVLLQDGGRSPAGRATAAVLLAALSRSLGAPAIATVGTADPFEGVHWAGGKLQRWPVEGAVTTGRDRLWLGLTGGYGHVQSAHHVAADLRADVRIVGPFHAGVGVFLLARPSVEGEPGRTLPAVRVGLLLRATRGIARFYGGGTFGVWMWLGETDDPAESRPLVVRPSGMAEVGVDLVPKDGPLFVRLGAAAGYGLGFQVMGSAGIGVRWGR